MVIQRLPLSVFDIARRGRVAAGFKKKSPSTRGSQIEQQNLLCIDAEHVSNLVRPAA